MELRLPLIMLYFTGWTVQLESTYCFKSIETGIDLKPPDTIEIGWTRGSRIASSEARP